MRLDVDGVLPCKSPACGFRSIQSEDGESKQELDAPMMPQTPLEGLGFRV